MRILLLAVALAGFWLALSGYFKPLLLVFGVATVGLCLVMASRMRTADDEGVPVQVLLGFVTYFPWLFWEIVKSAWSVTKVIIDPRLPISPTMTVVTASQKTPVGVTVFANSITLTPGTLTSHVKGNELTVHAIVRGGVEDLSGMDARVAKFEGRS